MIWLALTAIFWVFAILVDETIGFLIANKTHMKQYLISLGWFSFLCLAFLVDVFFTVITFFLYVILVPTGMMFFERAYRQYNKYLLKKYL